MRQRHEPSEVAKVGWTWTLCMLAAIAWLLLPSAAQATGWFCDALGWWCPGHQATRAPGAPELNPTAAVSMVVLLVGGLLIAADRWRPR